MAKLNQFLVIFLCLFFINIFASDSDLNVSYLNPTFENDWGIIDIVHFSTTSSKYNPFLSVYNTDMRDASITYVFNYNMDNENIKKEVESINKLNHRYQDLQSNRNTIISKGTELVGMAVAAGILDVAVSALYFPLIFPLLVTEASISLYLFYDIVDDTLDYYSDYVELVRATSNNYNSLLYKVNMNNNELVKMGISNEKYKGTSKNDYAQILYLGDSIDSKLLVQRENSIKDDLKNLVLTDYSNLLNKLNVHYSHLMHSDASAHSKLLNIYVLQEKIKKNLIEENDLLNTESQTLQNTIFNKLKYSKENYYDIDDYYIMKFSLISTDYVITPQEHVNLGYLYYEDALSEIEIANRLLKNRNDNYLVDSSIHFDNAIFYLIKSEMELSNAQVKSEKIYSQSKFKTISKYEDAMLEYDSLMTYTETDIENKQRAKKYLDEANKLIYLDGTASQKLLNLVLADSKIDSALILLHPSTLFYDNIKDETISSLNYLEKIINLAKKDKVDVFYEEEYLRAARYLLKDPSITLVEMLEISDDVVLLSNDIYDKAKFQYSHLDSKFDSFKSIIITLRKYDSSIKFDEYDVISNYYVNGAFDKYSSLGNYVTISSTLQVIENKINLNKKKIIEEMLTFNSIVSSNYYSQIELDVPSKLIIFYSTYFKDNSLEYNGPIKFEIPFTYDPYAANNVTKSNDLSFSYNNKKLGILINSFDWTKVYSFTLEYEKIFAKTLSVKYSSNPISSSSVQINIEHEIENMDISSLKFSKTNAGESADIFINGEFYGRFTEKNFLINKPLSSGKNKIIESYLFENPVVYSISEISSVDGVKKLKVNVKNVLPYEMKNQPLIVDLPFLTPTSYYFVENTCKVDKNGFKFSSSSENSKVYFVSDYVSNAQCSFVVEFVGEYNKTKIRDEIDSLLNETGDSKTKDLLNKAKKNIDSDKLDDAFNDIEKAKDLILDEKEKIKENLLLEDEYNRTKNELNNIISELSSIENKKVSDILAKAEKSISEAETLDDVNKKILKLITAKAELDKLKGIGIDTKLNLLTRSNKLIEQWMELVNVGFREGIPQEIEDNLFLLNGIDFSVFNADDFELLFSIEEKVISYEKEMTGLNKDKKEWESNLSVINKQLVAKLTNLIKQVETSCGSECPSDMLLIAKSNIEFKPTTSQMYSISNSKINESITQLSNYLELEKKSALSAFEDAKNFVSGVTNEELRANYLRKLSDIQSKINSGNYLAAKKEAVMLMSSMYDSNSSSSLFENNNLYLILAGVGAIILAFLLIKIKSQNDEKSKKEPEFKTLKKSTDNVKESKSEPENENEKMNESE